MKTRKPLVAKKPMRRKALKPKRKVHPMGSRGESLVTKGPLASKAHLDLVRAQQCLVTRAHGCHAHHPRELFPRTAGRRITDFLCVPLRPDYHEGHNHSLHKQGQKGGSPTWWAKHGWSTGEIFRYLRTFLLRHYPASHPGVVQAFAKMAEVEERQPATSGRTGPGSAAAPPALGSQS